MNRWRAWCILPNVDGKPWRQALVERRGQPLGERRTHPCPAAFEHQPFALLAWLVACEWQDRRGRLVAGFVLTLTFLIHGLVSLVARWL